MMQLYRSAITSVSSKMAGLLGFHRGSLDTFPVRVVVTGIEHSGTTLLSTLLQQDPRLKSGFECGLLLADSPREFKDVQPWYDWMQEPVSAHQWGISAEHMVDICSSRSWEDAYGKLLRYSPVFDHPEYQQVCDKTPRYLSCLDRVLDKLPDFVPCIVIEKDTADLWRSHRKRNSSLDDFCRMFARYNTGLRKALNRHGGRILRVKYGRLCTDLQPQLKSIFTFVDLPFKTEYASRRSADIQHFHQKRIAGAPPLSAKEVDRIERLKDGFSDLLF